MAKNELFKDNEKRIEKLYQEAIKFGQDNLISEVQAGRWYYISDEFSEYLDNVNYGKTNILELLKPVLESRTITNYIFVELLEAIFNINNMSKKDRKIKRVKPDDFFFEYFPNIAEIGAKFDNYWSLGALVNIMFENEIFNKIPKYTSELDHEFKYILSYLKAINMFYEENHKRNHKLDEDYISKLMVINNYEEFTNKKFIHILELGNKYIPNHDIGRIRVMSENLTNYFKEANYGDTNILKIIQLILETGRISTKIFNNLMMLIFQINKTFNKDTQRIEVDDLFIKYFNEYLNSKKYRFGSEYPGKKSSNKIIYITYDERIKNDEWGLDIYELNRSFSEFALIIDEFSPRISDQERYELEYINSYLEVLREYIKNKRRSSKFNEEDIKLQIIEHNRYLFDNNKGLRQNNRYEN